MKQKIKTALQQKYNSNVQGGLKLGLGEDAFERVASVAETFITDESKIADFVNAESTLTLLKGFQAEGDKVRTELNAKIKDLETKLNDNNDDNGQNPNPTQSQEPNPQDIATLIQSAVTSAIQPLQAELAQMKSEAQSKSTVTSANDAFRANDYVKKYADEANDAWERALEIYEATGNKMTKDELQQRAMGYFNKAVSRKGVDTSVPFANNGGDTSEQKADFSEMRQRLVKKGMIQENQGSK